MSLKEIRSKWESGGVVLAEIQGRGDAFVSIVKFGVTYICMRYFQMGEDWAASKDVTSTEVGDVFTWVSANTLVK